ncbi:MAG: hypothetical protein ACHQ16_05535, partial [Candidatus Lutacidiplasmatales archaeon]
MMPPGLGTHVRAAVGFGTLAVGLLLLTILGAPSVGSAVAAVHSPARGLAVSAQPSGNTSINDAVDLTGSSPSASFPAGTVLRVSWRFTMNSTTSATQATIYLPQLQAVFPATPAPVQIFLNSQNITGGFGLTISAASGAVTLHNATTFNKTGRVTFTSELAALMGSEPFGDLVVLPQWNWSVTTPAGVTTTSGWGPSPPPTIHPALVATLQSLVPKSLTPPAPVTACLTGPLQGRTFSLHAETPKPVDDFVANTTRDPIGGPSTFCLTIVILANITPQPLLIHIWDYESVTLLLYIEKVTVTNGSGEGTNGTGPDWTEYADVAIVVGAVGVG